MKHKIKLLITGIIVLAVLAILLVSINLINSPTGSVVRQDDEIVIGAILPLTGDLSIVGIEARRGMELAIEDLKNFNIKIIYEDDEFSAVKSVNAANKLINVDNVDVGLTIFVEESKPTTPLFERGSTPLLTVWDSTEFVKQSDYLFSSGFSTEIAGESMADYAYNELGLRKIAIVSHQDAWSEVISESFGDEFKSVGGDILFHEKLAVAEKDYRASILKIKESGADGVYMPLIPPTSVNFLLQADQLDLDVQLLEGDALFFEVIDEAGGAAEGIYYTNIYVDNSDNLRRMYVERYGKEPLDITIVSFGYTGIKTITEAYEADPDNLRLGLVDVIDPSGTLDREERIYQVIDGEGVLVS